MKLQGNITESEFVSFQRLHIKPRPLFKILGGFVGLAFAVALIGGIACAVTGRMEWNSVIALLVFTLTGLLYYLYFLPRQFKKAYQSQKMLHTTVDATIGDEEIHIASKFGEVHIPWNLLCKYKENEIVFAFYETKNIAHIIPKRWFPDQAGVDEFRSLLSSKIG